MLSFEPTFGFAFSLKSVFISTIRLSPPPCQRKLIKMSRINNEHAYLACDWYSPKNQSLTLQSMIASEILSEKMFDLLTALYVNDMPTYFKKFRMTLCRRRCSCVKNYTHENLWAIVCNRIYHQKKESKLCEWLNSRFISENYLLFTALWSILVILCIDSWCSFNI